MHILVDEIVCEPAHTVTPEEIRRALDRLPIEWTQGIKTVRISASMSARCIASYSRVSSRLVLCTRGRAKSSVLAAMHRELFAKATQAHSVPEWRLSEGQRSELDRKVDEQLVRAGYTTNEKKKWA